MIKAVVSNGFIKNCISTASKKCKKKGLPHYFNATAPFFFLYQKLRRPAAAFSISFLYFFWASICFWASLPACTSDFVHGTILHITMYRASS